MTLNRLFEDSQQTAG